MITKLTFKTSSGITRECLLGVDPPTPAEIELAKQYMAILVLTDYTAGRIVGEPIIERVETPCG